MDETSAAFEPQAYGLVKQRLRQWLKH